MRGVDMDQRLHRLNKRHPKSGRQIRRGRKSSSVGIGCSVLENGSKNNFVHLSFCIVWTSVFHSSCIYLYFVYYLFIPKLVMKMYMHSWQSTEKVILSFVKSCAEQFV